VSFLICNSEVVDTLNTAVGVRKHPLIYALDTSWWGKNYCFNTM